FRISDNVAASPACKDTHGDTNVSRTRGPIAALRRKKKPGMSSVTSLAICSLIREAPLPDVLGIRLAPVCRIDLGSRREPDMFRPDPVEALALLEPCVELLTNAAVCHARALVCVEPEQPLPDVSFSPQSRPRRQRQSLGGPRSVLLPCPRHC